MDQQYIEAKVIEKKADGGFVAVASSAKEDRHGEIVNQEGWDIKNFKKAPRLLWAHDHRIPAIGKATKIWIEGKGKSAKLMFEGVFHEITEMGKAAKQLFEEGYVDTFSVGFLPKEMEGNEFIEQELLEISLVNVPANADAMAKACKSLREGGFPDEIINGLGYPILVLDRLEEMNKDISELKKNAVKEPKTPASQNLSGETRKRLSMVKVIARASDKILVAEKTGEPKKKRIDTVKLIKLTAQKLIEAEKGN